MAAGSTYTPIATTTLNTTATSVTFNSIGSYTDIIVVYNGTATDFVNIGLQFNSDTGNNYVYTRTYGDGTTAYSDRATNFSYAGFGIIGTAQSTAIAHVHSYSNSSAYKNVLGRGNTSLYVSKYAAMWRSTAAITSIKVVVGSNSFNSGSTFTLYGIQAA